MIFFYIYLTSDGHANTIISRCACMIIWCPECWKWHFRAWRPLVHTVGYSSLTSCLLQILLKPLPNLTSEPHFLKRNKPFCQVHVVYTPETHSINAQLPVLQLPKPPVHQTSTKHSANVSLDPNNLLPHDIRAKFRSLLDEYNQIFDPNIKGYNGVEGPFEAIGNLGSCGTSPMRRQASPICLPPTTGTPRLVSLKHWTSLNAPKTSTSQLST